MDAFRDRVVVVTGAGSGIGRSTALAFAREGARVHLVDLRRDRLDAVIGEIDRLELPGTRCAHTVDCAVADAVLALAEEIYRREGRVDVLHNNAGVVCAGPVEKTPLDDWRWILGINLWGVIHGVHAFVPRMITQGGGGHVVNTASMAGLVGLPQVVPYCTSKFAVVGLTEALAAELAVHGIGVTLVCPGAVRTPMMEDSPRMRLPGAWRDTFAKIIERRGHPPEAVAEQILDAVREKRYLVVPGGDMAPLWWIKRASTSLYAVLAGHFAKWAVQRAERKDTEGA